MADISTGGCVHICRLPTGKTPEKHTVAPLVPHRQRPTRWSRMTPEHAYEISYEPGTNVTTFGLPASYEDMQYLELDPLTGEPMEVTRCRESGR